MNENTKEQIMHPSLGSSHLGPSPFGSVPLNLESVPLSVYDFVKPKERGTIPVVHVKLVLKDKIKTAFMQGMDVFEKNKVIFGTVMISCAKFGPEEIEKMVASETNEIAVIGAVASTGYSWYDESVKVISDGQRFYLLADYVTEWRN